MSEQIKELAKQAQVDGDAIHYYSSAFVEKFAKLIIKECIDAMLEVLDEESCDDEFYRGYDAGVMGSINTVKAHFGVE